MSHPYLEMLHGEEANLHHLGPGNQGERAREAVPEGEMDLRGMTISEGNAKVQWFSGVGSVVQWSVMTEEFIDLRTGR